MNISNNSDYLNQEQIQSRLFQRSSGQEFNLYDEIRTIQETGSAEVQQILSDITNVYTRVDPNCQASLNYIATALCQLKIQEKNIQTVKRISSIMERVSNNILAGVLANKVPSGPILSFAGNAILKNMSQGQMADPLFALKTYSLLGDCVVMIDEISSAVLQPEYTESYLPILNALH